MNINDNVYGNEEIKEEVLIELIKCKEMQRLKKISQQGLPQEYYHKKINSRFEHSLGVLILLRRMNAGLKEQITGLLHDASHTAFSHVVDWVIGDGRKEDYQDKAHEEMIKNSEIAKILEKYGINYEDVNKLEMAPLLDMPLPELCADRFDYSIREMVEYLDKEAIDKFVCNLVNLNGRIAFKNKEIGEIFAREYAKCQREHWAGNDARVRYCILSDILRKAIERKYIQFEDFKLTDMEVIRKIKKSKDEELIGKLKLLKSRLEILEDNEGITMPKKFRWLDPFISEDGKNLSEISKSYKDFIENEKIVSANRDGVGLRWKSFENQRFSKSWRLKSPSSFAKEVSSR